MKKVNKTLQLEKKLRKVIAQIIKCRIPSTCTNIMIFLAMMFAMIGPFYMFDLPQIYEDVIIRKFNKTSVDVESLYAIYSLPNFIMTPLGSFLLGYTGLGLGAVLFESLVVIGSMMIYYGFNTGTFAYLFWGRAVYGLGSEVVVILGATIADRWFSGKLLSIA